MKRPILLLSFALLFSACRQKPAPWTGPELQQPREQLTVEQLLSGSQLDYVDMSFYARPEWAGEAKYSFSGSLSFPETELNYPTERAPYEGENIFPGLSIDFIANEGVLIPLQKDRMLPGPQSKTLWAVVLGTGKVWQEPQDGEWSRASFPLTLTDQYIGQSRNCVATFVFKTDTISDICVQCSQENADLNDRQVGNMLVRLPAAYQSRHFEDSAQVVEKYLQFEKNRLSVLPLSAIDKDQKMTHYFEKSIYTNASTSLGALCIDEKLYLNSPKTRHGLYPYPAEMRHGLYSVTKSLAGALSLLYFAERYGATIFDERITDFVPALASHPGWQDVTFGQTLNMETGTVGGEDAERLFNVLILARTAEESIQNIAGLGDAPEAPGEKFNYASTNSFVLSYALQKYVEQKEGTGIYYWDLVHEQVLVPIGAEYFTVMHTVETDGSKGIPRLAYGALPTIDEAAKIALLFSDEGNYKGQQLLNREKTREALGRAGWKGYSTNNDYRGNYYRHGFWANDVRANGCKVDVTYMLGYGANYIWFFPSGAIAFRFMDEYDLDFKELVRGVEGVRSSCE